MLEIKDYLSYSPETGLFTRIKSIRGKYGVVGRIAGHKNKDGRVYIHHKNKRYLAHRLAWYFYYGVPPLYPIDHINEDPTDNRICNLRLDTNKQNQQNISKPRSHNISGMLGVSYYKRLNKWRTRITIDGKEKNIGYYNTPEEAHEAYLCAKRELHPFWVEGK